MKAVSQKSIVLLSSGLDSTVNLLAALKEGDVVLALTFDYGQKAAKKEIEKSKALCQKYNVPHQVIELPFFKKFTKTSLIAQDQEIPRAGDVNIHSQEQSLKTADRVWVPNRNGIFLNIAAGFAEGLQADAVVPGFNAEEAATFPDNSQEYQRRLEESFALSTQNKIKVKCFTVNMDKAEIIKWGMELGLNVKDIWPCYFAGEVICEECESCLRFKNALKRSGVAP